MDCLQFRCYSLQGIIKHGGCLWPLNNNNNDNDYASAFVLLVSEKGRPQINYLIDYCLFNNRREFFNCKS